MKMSALELIQRRIDEIESQLAEPCAGRVVVETRLARKLIEEARERGETVSRDPETNIFSFSGLGPVMIDATLPKNCFKIELT